MYLIIFIVLFIIWYLYFYQIEEIKNEFKIIINNIIEKDFEYYSLIIKNKSFNKSIKDRLIYSLISFIFFNIILIKYQLLGFIISFILMILVYFLYYYLLKNEYHLLVKKTNDLFPYYLNNLAILVQQNAVPIALNKSIDLAPEVFKRDLQQLVYEIHNNNVNIDPYLNFSKKFESIDDINRVMRTLYNLAFKANNKEVIITSLSKITNEKLANQIKLDYQSELDKQQLWPYYLFLWLGLLIIKMIMAIKIF